MENAIISIICLALIVCGSMTLSQGFLSSLSNTSSAMVQSNERSELILRTNITITDTAIAGDNVVRVAVKNIGETRLSEYEKWDVIIQYTGADGQYRAMWLPYTSGALEDNTWRVGGIYMNAAIESPEVFEPGILNHGEEMVILSQLNPGVGMDTANMVAISTPSGVSASFIFTRGTP